MKKRVKSSRRVFDTPSGKTLTGLRQRVVALKSAETQREQVEEALRESEERYRVLVEAAPDVVYIISGAGKLASLNPAFEAITGWSCAKWLGKPFVPLVHPEDATLAVAMFQKALQGNRPPPYELRIRSRSGKYLVGEFTSTPYIKNGKVAGILGIARDITGRKQVEEALRESSSQVQLAIEAAKMGIWRADLTTRTVVSSKTSGPISGLPPGEVPTSQEEFLGLIHPEDRPRAAQHLTEAIEKSGKYQLEFRIVRRDGTVRWVYARGQVFHDANGRPTFMTGVDLDITARRQMEERIAKLSSFKQKLLGTDSINEKLKLITDSVVEIFGADFARIWLTKEADLCKKGCRHARVSEGPNVCRDRTQCLHLIASSGRYARVDGSHRRVPLGAYKIGRVASGEDASFVTNDVVNDPRVHDHEWARSLGLVSFAGYRLLSTDGKSIGVLALFRQRAILPDEEPLLLDLANTVSQVIIGGMAQEERHKLEAQMQEAQRLESLGVLAGGIAHDFNNLLTAVLGHANLALAHLPPDSAVRDNLQEIDSASRRAAELCRQMLAYSGRARFVIESINLSRLARELTDLLQVSVSKKTAMQCHFAADLPALEGDPA